MTIPLESEQEANHANLGVLADTDSNEHMCFLLLKYFLCPERGEEISPVKTGYKSGWKART